MLVDIFGLRRQNTVRLWNLEFRIWCFQLSGQLAVCSRQIFNSARWNLEFRVSNLINVFLPYHKREVIIADGQVALFVAKSVLFSCLGDIGICVVVKVESPLE